jgi:maltose alpha-D-glucosyltransferase/alpha-amylase
VNVEKQRRDPKSLLSWTASMIRLRKECPEIGWGDWTLVQTGAPTVLAMRYDWRGNSLVTLHNFDGKSHEAKFKLQNGGGEKLVSLLQREEIRADDSGTHRIALEAYGYRWYRVGDVEHILRRSKE